jgi:hypothetical protein
LKPAAYLFFFCVSSMSISLTQGHELLSTHLGITILPVRTSLPCGK